MTLDLPGWAWMGVVWVAMSVCVALGIARWFRWMSEYDERENHW